MPIKNDLTSARKQLDKNLAKYLTLPKGKEKRLTEAMRYSVLGEGKAFRAFLVLTVGKILGLKKTNALQIATALEMVHTYSLIHDDLPAMDNDTLRRGKPTNHIAFDEATAILAGDGLLTLAFEVLADKKTHQDTQIRSDLIQMLAQKAGKNGMAGGQMIDLIGEKVSLSLKDIEYLQSLKTGCLLNYAVMAPAGAAKASKKQKQALEKYAHAIGLMFQITDDILDVEGTQENMGKTLGKDKLEKKSTFVSLLGLEKARQKALQLEKEALNALEIFDKKGQNMLVFLCIGKIYKNMATFFIFQRILLV